MVRLRGVVSEHKLVLLCYVAVMDRIDNERFELEAVEHDDTGEPEVTTRAMSWNIKNF